MKKRILVACILTLLSLFAFFGCRDGNTGANNSNSGQVSLENVIFGGDFKIVISEDFEYSQTELQSRFDEIVYNLTGNVTDINKDTASEYKHEILIGTTNRDISTKAYKRLEQLKGEDESLIGYVVYSNGKSLAVAYDSEDSLELALAELEKNYLSPSYGKMTVDSGTLVEWSYELKLLYEERDAEIMAQRWAALEKEVNQKGYDGKATVNALQNLYSLYSDKIYIWMADLYDPVTGGFYYSNSGRNTVGFAPDIESTMQVLNLVRYSGMINHIDEIPDTLKTSVIKFIKGLQSSTDGYFYHPQWEGLEITDERRGRDQMWSIEIFKMFGEKPLYTTGGLEGSLGAPGAKATSHLTAPFGSSLKSEISKVVPCAAEHLSSEAKFKEYLDSQNWKDSYTTGNRLAAQVVDIKSAGLLPYLINYLNAKQNSQNGMWEERSDDYAVNGFLKIGAVYQAANAVIPNSKKASETCINVLLSKTPAGTVCWVYNVWYALDIITGLLYDSKSGENISLADEIVADLRKNAATYLNVAAEKYATFLKRDGTFSFTPDQTSDLSQGMPVAVTGTNEGDVNATYISSIGLTGYIFGVLGYEKVELYTENDYKLFLNRLGGLGEIIKTNTSMGGGVDFEDGSYDGIHYAENTVLGKTPDKFESDDEKGFAYAQITTDSEKSGNVLEYTKPDDTYETRLEFLNRTTSKSRYIFEFDMKYLGGELTEETWHTRFAFYNYQRFWYLLIYPLADGTLALGDFENPMYILNPNEWYTLRFEYYSDTPDKACKIYVNNQLVGEGGTSNPVKVMDGQERYIDDNFSRAFIEYRREATNISYLFDNVRAASDDEPYNPPIVDAGDAIGSHYPNADFKGDRYDYDSEDAVLPKLLNNSSGTLAISDGVLKFSLKNSDNVDAVIYERQISEPEKMYKNICKIFEFEFSYSGVTTDTPFTIFLGNQKYNFAYDAKNKLLNIVDPYNKNNVIATNLKADTVYVLRFECYANADNGMYNITKVYVGETQSDKYTEKYAGQLLSEYVTAVTILGIGMNKELAGTDAYITLENVLLSNVDKAYVKESTETNSGSTPLPEIEAALGAGAFYNSDKAANRFDYNAISGAIDTAGVTQGSSDTAYISNGALVYSRNNLFGESYMRWNHVKLEGFVTPVFVFETDFRFDGFVGNNPQQKIIIQANGISHTIVPTFATVNNVQTMTVGKMTLNEGAWYNIRFELDYTAGALYYFLDGEYAGFDYLSKTETTYQRVIWYYMNKQTDGTMSFDNTFEGIVEDGTICETHIDENADDMCDKCPLEIPKPLKPDAILPENTLGGGVLYNGTAVGTRFNYDSDDSGVNTGGVTSNDAVKIKNGHFIFVRNNDTGSGESYIRWNITKPTDLQTPVFIFETDFCFTDFSVNSQSPQKIVIQANGISHQITPQLSSDGQSMTLGKLLLSADTWYNIRFELDYAAGRVNYFLNGIFEGYETLSAATTNDNRVLWYYLAKQTGGTMAFDNTFADFAEEGSTAVCAAHTDADKDGVCDKCGAKIEAEAPPAETPDNPPQGSGKEEDNTDEEGWVPVNN